MICVIFQISTYIIMFIYYASGETEMTTVYTSENTKLKFAGMLQEILRINELRFETMKKMIQLQMQRPLLYSTLSGDRLTENRRLQLTIEKKHSILDVEQNSRHESFENEDILDNSSFKREDEAGHSDNASLGRREDNIYPNCMKNNWKNCQINSARLCNRACIESIKKACKMFNCTRYMFHESDRVCRRSCKLHFVKV